MVADGRLKAVNDQLYPRYTDLRSIPELCRMHFFEGKTKDLTEFAGLERMETHSTRSLPTDFTQTVVQINKDREPAVRCRTKKIDVSQLHNIDGLGSEMADDFKAKLNEDFCEALNTNSMLGAVWAVDSGAGGNASYLVNADADDLTQDDFDLAQAIMLEKHGAQQGARVRYENLLWIVNSFGERAIKNSGATYIQLDPASGEAGIRRIGVLNGIPVIHSEESVSRRRAVTATDATTTGTGTVITFTFAAGHGFHVGEKVTSPTGFDAHETVTTPTAIDTVTATTIAITIVGGTDGTSSTNGDVLAESTPIRLIDRNECHSAYPGAAGNNSSQLGGSMPLPTTEIRDDFQSTNQAPYVYLDEWGFYCRPRHVLTVNAPA